jgi:threonine dehydratase
VIGVEPDICTPFANSIAKKERVSSEKVSKFCNGSSLKSVGEFCFRVGRTCIDGFVSVNENKVAETIIKLYSFGYIC